MKKSNLLLFILSITVLMSGCIKDSYTFKTPVTDDPVRERLFACDAALAKTRDPAARSLYYLEQGLIYEKILHREPDALDSFRKEAVQLVQGIGDEKGIPSLIQVLITIAR